MIWRGLLLQTVTGMVSSGQNTFLTVVGAVIICAGLGGAAKEFFLSKNTTRALWILVGGLILYTLTRTPEIMTAIGEAFTNEIF